MTAVEYVTASPVEGPPRFVVAPVALLYFAI